MRFEGYLPNTYGCSSAPTLTWSLDCLVSILVRVGFSSYNWTALAARLDVQAFGQRHGIDSAGTFLLPFVSAASVHACASLQITVFTVGRWYDNVSNAPVEETTWCFKPRNANKITSVTTGPEASQVCTCYWKYRI